MGTKFTKISNSESVDRNKLRKSVKSHLNNREIVLNIKVKLQVLAL